jgi:hypothetical protein
VAESLLPREHGAYGQVSLPLLTAFVVGGFSLTGVAVGVAAVGGFMAHEPAAVVLGRRGPRARREAGVRAVRWLVFLVALTMVSGVGALLVAPAYARWSLLVPAAPAAVVAVAMLRGREKSLTAEVAAAVAFSGAAVPVVLGSGHPLVSALSVAIPFALMFSASTLAVRAVIARVRAGGDAHAAAITGRAALLLAAVGLTGLSAATALGILPFGVLLATIPGLAVAAAIVLRPPAPTRLRTIGWTLVAASVATAVTIVAAE